MYGKKEIGKLIKAQKLKTQQLPNLEGWEEYSNEKSIFNPAKSQLN